MLLGDTILRLRYAEDLARPRLATPGEVRRIATNTIFADAERPSRVVLPLLR